MDIESLLLVDKPKGWTSHDVVDFLRQLTGWKKVGHFGSLDPLATGLLLLGIGRATRLFPFLSRQPKVYQGIIRLGLATDTYDADGKPISLPSSHLPTENKLKEIIKSFEGEIEQLPPPFSAKKHKGKPLYQLARKGQPVLRKPVKVRIYEFQIISYRPPDLSFLIACSSGTYIRSLAHDLGQIAGCGAHLAQLVRLAIGPFRLEKAFSPAQIEEYFKKGQIYSLLCPLEMILENLSKAILTEKINLPLARGRAIPPHFIKVILPPTQEILTYEEEKVIRLFSFEGRFLGLARQATKPGYLIPFLLI
ncbi:MAG: tRNA pseudouridine(55) synthase TruB [Candidatus Aminicenantes bacterium]|nr:tRNA pseudouridine(55) synthase TruB [Candidatus Aminicenantes bacterium]